MAGQQQVGPGITSARPLDIYYVDTQGERYRSTASYPLVRATDIEPDAALERKPLSVALLRFVSGDLPGGDHIPARVGAWLQGLREPERARELHREARARNEVYLKLGVDYYARTMGDDGKPNLQGPHNAEFGLQFVVQDYERAGRFTDRRIFDNIRINQGLTMRVQLQEIDDPERELRPYMGLLQDTGLDGALNLASASPVIGIASSLFRNIAKLNTNDTVWDEAFTLATDEDARGQSFLRAGIYVLLEGSARVQDPGPMSLPGASDNGAPPAHLAYRDGTVVEPGPDGAPGAPSRRTYLVLAIYPTPTPKPPRPPGRAARGGRRSPKARSVEEAVMAVLPEPEAPPRAAAAKAKRQLEVVQYAVRRM